jgi:8-oxo-dGTP diphosphatase
LRLVGNATAAGVLLVRPPNVLLVQRANDPWAGFWSIPGGFVDQGEHPEKAARREIREEVGVETVMTRLLGVYLRRTPPGEWIQTTLYVGSTLDEPRLADGESLAVGWFRVDALPDPLVPGDDERIDDYIRSERPIG